MFEQDTRAREAHEREEEQIAFMKRALENPQPIATLYDLDKARMASLSADDLTKHKTAAQPALDLSGYSADTLRGMLKVATKIADRAHDAMLAARQR